MKFNTASQAEVTKKALIFGARIQTNLYKNREFELFYSVWKSPEMLHLNF